ncbi:hypothetical protein E2C01_018871 [Portunus trituberculatus]|uniref:Uncharacterized protein n=1 Tax=Portunus trituberculatus TaxID=210409 RepID=A0A5B7DXC9_PORTR|nr:hypothetical protein [Portunus trituberculatus]
MCGGNDVVTCGGDVVEVEEGEEAAEAKGEEEEEKEEEEGNEDEEEEKEEGNEEDGEEANEKDGGINEDEEGKEDEKEEGEEENEKPEEAKEEGGEKDDDNDDEDGEETAIEEEGKAKEEEEEDNGSESFVTVGSRIPLPDLGVTVTAWKDVRLEMGAYGALGVAGSNLTRQLKECGKQEIFFRYYSRRNVSRAQGSDASRHVVKCFDSCSSNPDREIGGALWVIVIFERQLCFESDPALCCMCE